MERWRDIPDYEGSYQVSDFGRVKSLAKEKTGGIGNYKRKERILKTPLSFGYRMVSLSNGPKVKSFKVSVLVAMAFLDHKTDGHKVIVDHKDNIRTNDYLSNLQLITNRENSSKDRFRGNYSSKYVGVCWKKENMKWAANIVIDGKLNYLGYFVNELDAHNAYQESKEELEESILVK